MEKSEVHAGRVISAMFLVAGTCIGGGMLALPVATGTSGFFPSLVIMLVCWAAMTATALLLLEVSMWMEEGVHLITMTSRLLGVPGKVISWALYLFICYASIVGYTAGGGVQIAQGVNDYFGSGISKEVGAAIFIFTFGAVIYLGSHIVGRVNAVLFIAMVAAYIALVGIGIPEIKESFLFSREWSHSFMAIPLLLTSFSFQTMIPSLTPYLERNVGKLRIAIVGGTTIALVIYAIWQLLILGIVPAQGPNSLTEALVLGEPATQFLREHVEGKWVVAIAEYFAFFAIVTSFLGMALGLFDFLADGLHIKKDTKGKILLGFLIVAPTLICATYFERAFIVAFETSGGFGDSILNGIIPVMMAWIGRYKLEQYRGNPQCLSGGKPVLFSIGLFFLFALMLTVALQTGAMARVLEPFESRILTQ